MEGGGEMTRDDIKRMAQEAGFEEGYGNHLFPPGDYREEVVPVTDEIIRFAALVAAAEREACATVCEKQIKSYMSKQYTTDPLGGFRERFAAEQCAAAIRARGET
jgi:hypothetical protein